MTFKKGQCARSKQSGVIVEVLEDEAIDSGILCFKGIVLISPPRDSTRHYQVGYTAFWHVDKFELLDTEIDIDL